MDSDNAESATDTEQYPDARELHPEFVRWDCKFCDHGWIRDTGGRPNYGRCPECGYSQDNDYMAHAHGVRKVVDGMDVKYVEVG